MLKNILSNKINFKDSEGVLPVEKGGTGGDDLDEIAENLGLIRTVERNAASGVAGLDNQGKIPMSLIPAGVGTGGSTATIDGPTTVTVGSTVSYTIVGYSSFETYTVVASAGTATRSGATITYTAPATAQTVQLTVNGKAVTVNVVPVTAYVNTPAVTSPTTGATNLGPDVVVTASAFAVTGGSDTHEGTDWQIATDASFSNVVASATNSSTAKTSYTATGLAPSTTYYVRLRYKGTTMGYSNWSTTTSFSTKSSYVVQGIEQVKITGEATNQYFGASVAINSTGDTIVVGAYGAYSYTGYVKVYKNISGTWTLQGDKIVGGTTDQYFGVSVAINSIGDTIVVGAHGAYSGTGYVKVYKNISGTWTQQGATIAGEANNDRFGYSVSISASGDTIVVGAYGANAQTGYAKVYKNISGTWTQQGAKITGEATNEYFGHSVSISASGDAVVVGAHYANSYTGYVKVYKNISNTWTLQGAKIVGETTNQWFGRSVSINSTGDTIVVGAYGANSYTGYAKVYK